MKVILSGKNISRVSADMSVSKIKNLMKNKGMTSVIYDIFTSEDMENLKPVLNI